MTAEELEDRRQHPDPTARTIEALNREIENLEDKMDAGFEHRANVTGLAISGLNQRFDMTEDMRIEQKADTKAAVDAALTAQKEAVKEQTIAAALSIAKSEAATAEQLKQLNATFTAGLSALDGKNGDLKDRLAGVESDFKSRMTIIEATKQGGRENTAALYIGMLALVAIINMLLTAYHMAKG